MSTALSVFDPAVGVPAHIAAFFGEDGNSNIENKATVPSLSPGGKIWTISIDGEKMPLLKKNTDGDEEPVNVMRTVILEFAKRRGRAFYEGNFDPDNISAPVCWSADGVAPDDTVVDKKSAKCGDCPFAAKGSKVGENGRAQIACSTHRMLAVIPSQKLDFEPLRLKISVTSDWDKESKDEAAKGWFAFQQYMDWLKTKGVNHSAAVVTKMKFDQSQTYPKILFAADRWLDASELAQVAPLTKDAKVLALLSNTYTPAGADGVRTDAAKPAAAAAAAPEPEVGIGGASDDDDDGGEIMIGGMSAPAATPVQEPAQAKVAAPKATKTTASPKAAVAPVTPEPAPATSVVDTGLGDLLDNWGDD